MSSPDASVSAEQAIDPRQFRTVLGQFCTGITIITTVDDGEPVGFACQSFAALSLDPPLVLFCPTKGSRSWAAIERTGKFAVNVLAEEQQAVCARFGSREPDKFAGIDWTPSPLARQSSTSPLHTSTARWKPSTTAAITTSSSVGFRR